MDAANWNENTGERRAWKHASGVRRRAGKRAATAVPRLRPILLSGDKQLKRDAKRS